MTDGEPANYRVDDSLCRTSDTCPEHVLGLLLLAVVLIPHMTQMSVLSMAKN
jgi:hypothetical protein